MNISEERIELARAIISTKATVLTDCIDIHSDDTEFIEYKDKFIKVTAAKNTKALVVTIYKPLTSSKNPIIYVDDDGKCFRCHGEGIYFKEYAEKILGNGEQWRLDPEVEQKYLPCIEQFIDDIAANADGDELLTKDFSNTELNPYTMCKILENIGYEQEEQYDNGWELDYWITMIHPEKPTIVVNGTGICFTLNISEKD